MSIFKKITTLLLVLCLFAGLTACSKEDQKTITIFNWGDYINPDLLEEFEKETGIHVVYDTFASNEDMWTKFTTSGNSYDLVIPSDYMIERMIKENLIAPLDFSKIPNAKNIFPEFTKLSYDPEMKYSVPYFWSSTGIIYDKEKITTPIDSWSALWDKQYADKVIMMDVPRTTIMTALKVLGYSVNSQDAKELEDAKQLLIEQKPLVVAYAGDNVKDMMLQGEGDLALIWSGEAYVVMENSDRFEYVVPKEGTSLIFDAMVIPAASEKKEEAHQFIDFMLRAENAVKNMDVILYNTPNRAAYELLSPEKKELLGAIPFEDMKKGSSEVFVDLGDGLNLYNKIWTEFKASNQ
ncbi:MAG: spermidine/putrescine ABC transporter substrate-binding protein [Eubacteriales bacterium]|nr:spermidine/putrescine ABC transporter substrate-binding protein [Eubacteriales bacterium]